MALQFGRSRLPELLHSRGKTQVDLAAHLGVSSGYISRVVKGTKRLSPLNMKRTAVFLVCHMDDLYEWVDDESD